MTIKEKAYQLYKLDWLNSHGYTMEDIVYRVMSILDENDFDFKNFNMSGNDVRYVLDLLEEIGFDGEIYVCYDEFIDNEYQDKEYIKILLDNEKLFEEYLKDIEED